MENSFQTSFIPKKPITTTLSSSSSRLPTSIFTVISFIIIIIVGVSSVGLFLYKNYLLKQEQILSSSLERVRDTFEKNTLDELELYDKRVSAANKVLERHIVFSPMFDLLGSLTIPSIQYTNFTQQTTGQGFVVKLAGIASDYKSIALQADAFNSAKGRSFKNVVFSDINKDKGNKVNFNIQFVVDPSLLSYEKNIVLEQAQQKDQIPVEQKTIDNTPVKNINNANIDQIETNTDTQTSNQDGKVDSQGSNIPINSKTQ